MSRDFLTFEVAGDRCHATLDKAEGAQVGLLMVSGGNEIRSGAFGGQARLAHEIAMLGFPVFRFDRRGVGDSEGENREFRSSAPDLQAAMDTFRAACPLLRRIVGYGNCDGAASLMLAGGAGCDTLVLANPWTFDEGAENDTPPAIARRRYVAKLFNPQEWKRVFTGQITPGKIAGAVRSSTAREQGASSLAREMAEAMRGFDGRRDFLVAGRDRTGLAFRTNWPESVDIAVCPAADHAFSGSAETAWLKDRLVSALEEQARQLDMG